MKIVYLAAFAVLTQVSFARASTECQTEYFCSGSKDSYQLVVVDLQDSSDDRQVCIAQPIADFGGNKVECEEAARAMNKK